MSMRTIGNHEECYRLASEYFLRKGFVEPEPPIKDGMGMVMIVEQEPWRFRIIRDRGDEFLDLGKSADPEEWFCLADIAIMIDGKSAGWDNKNIQDSIDYLEENWGRILEEFSEENVDSARSAYREVQQRRYEEFISNYSGST